MRRRVMVLALAAASLMAACTTAPVVVDPSAALAAAKTRGDHLRLAEHFDSKAKAYDTEAAEHARLAVQYQSGLGTAGRAERGAAMAAHCRQLQTQFTSAAEQARALAQAHRDMANATSS